MMDFVMLTLSFTAGILLASGLAMIVALNPKVMRMCMKYMLKQTNRFDQLVDDLTDEEL